MAIRRKIDSNETGLAFAEEVLGAPGTLPGTSGANAVWTPLEPNEYDDFGGELTLLARRPINPSRQRKKGAITDLEAAGGFNQDLTQTNTQSLLQGFMYASYREKPNQAVAEVTATGYEVASATGFAAGMLVLATGFGNSANNGLKVVTGVTSPEIEVAGLAVEALPPPGARLAVVGFQGTAGDLDIDVTGNFATITSTALDFTTLGLNVGEFIYVGGDSAGLAFATEANNGIKRVHSIAANALVIDKSDAPMANESTSTETVQLFFGRVLKNEQGNLIVRRSYQLERQLGAPDTAMPNAFQAEYIKGAFGNELTMNIEQADKITLDFGFIALDADQRTHTDGLKPGARATIEEADAYNTSTDFNSLRLAIFNGTDEAPDPLFGYLSELTVSINNNVSVNKAVAVLGGFDVTLGVFEVSAEMTAYFSTVEAVRAVRQNRDVTMHAFVAKNNAGFVMDIPLAALGDARLDVTIDEPIYIPLTMDAATAAKIAPGMDYTLLWTFFDYLPNRTNPT